MESETQQEDPAERALFETIRTTYALALEPEQMAMIKELRHKLTTISAGERTALIDDIESAISRDAEGSEYEY